MNANLASRVAGLLGNQRLDANGLRIIVLGYIIRGPMGGMVASNLQYLMGLALLGHEVYFVEDSDDFESCFDPRIGAMTVDPTYGLRFAEKSLRGIGFGSNWAYFNKHTSEWFGPRAGDIVSLCETADVVLNLCGVNPPRVWYENAPLRILVDQDPAFTQIKNLDEPDFRKRTSWHNAFFSFAENIEDLECSVPNDGFPWLPTRPPIVLDAWPRSEDHNGRFTTVMQWDSYKDRSHGGIAYGMKSTSFAPFKDLPLKVTGDFEVAIKAIPGHARKSLEAGGWRIVDPRRLSTTPWTYRRYLARSKAEFSVAKHGYVVSHSGWFSERSASYLAMGKPVVVQDTGFTKNLPHNEGILAFSSPEGAQAAVEDVNSRYADHSRTAREIAAAYFGHEAILSNLLAAAERAVAKGSVPIFTVPPNR